jgi:hypothetical protein
MRISVRASRVLVFLAVLALSCENVAAVRGTIINEADGMPLDSVKVSMLIGGDVFRDPASHALSDSLGKFGVYSGAYGCVSCGCPDVYLIVERDGFVTDTLKVESGDYQISMKSQ